MRLEKQDFLFIKTAINYRLDVVAIAEYNFPIQQLEAQSIVVNVAAILRETQVKPSLGLGYGDRSI